LEKLKNHIKKHKLLAGIIALIALITVVRLGMFFYGLIVPEEAEKTLMSVQVMDAEYQDITSTSPLSGRISAKDEVAIIPKVAGEVTSVNVKLGDYVTAGTVLFNIDSGTTGSTYSQVRASYNVAANNYENMKKLYAAGAISKSDFDSAEVAYINARESLNSTGELLSYYNVSSPIDGYVTSLNVSVGNMTSQQSMAASVANTDVLEINTSVSEYLAGVINIGDTVDLYVDGQKNISYQGTITEFSPAPAYGTLTYPITISIDSNTKDLKSGMFVEIKIKTDENKSVICIPSNSVMLKKGEQTVAVIDENRIVSFKKVRTGIDNGEYVEIVDGIKVGETVIISGQDFVNEGDEVRLVDADGNYLDEQVDTEDAE